MLRYFGWFTPRSELQQLPVVYCVYRAVYWYVLNSSHQGGVKGKMYQQ